MSLETGRNLRRIREQLRLRYRDVEEASKVLAKRHGSAEFVIGLSRLADIENRGIVPSIFRIYSISTIYGLDAYQVLQWYGVDLDWLPQDVAALKLEPTRPLNHRPVSISHAELPVEIRPPFDVKKTNYLNRHIKAWGTLPVSLLKALDPAYQRYAMVGTEDWSMYPIIVPGAFIQIDESKRRIVNQGWSDDYGRPIYFIEHRNGFRCCWCTERQGMLIVQSHHTSHVPAEVFKFPGEAEIIGQVVAVAMRFDQERRHRKRFSADLK